MQGHSAEQALVEWFKNEARRIYALIGETLQQRQRRRLVDFIREQSTDGTITVRALHRKLHRQYATAEDARL